MVIEPTRPKLNRFKYAAMLLGAMAVAAFPPVGLTAVATAEPNSGTWDLEDYETCMNGFPYDPETTTWQQIEDQKGYCCRRSGGVVDPASRSSNTVVLHPVMRRAHGSFRATFRFHPTSPPHPQ